MAAPLFLSVEQLIAIHRECVLLHGGAIEIRDYGLLDSAAAMPQASFGGNLLHEGLPAMAAAYLFHLCKNHPFVDGNNRVAIAAAEIFVELNDLVLVATDTELEKLTLGVADSSISKAEATEFFRQRVRDIPKQSARKSAKRRTPRPSDN